ncbi:MAG TPA: hypothetical protein VHV83_15835, partial [Armatimonadota bacterium]|nr:hypothetical protein [Armatimonadota bacterium]
PSQSFWSDIDVPAKVKQCPTAGKNIANAYVGNKFLDNVALGDVEYPIETMVVADGQHTSNGANDYDNIANKVADFANRHGNACIVGYLDGHVALTQDPDPWIRVCVDHLDGTSQYGITPNSPSLLAYVPTNYIVGSSATEHFGSNGQSIDINYMKGGDFGFAFTNPLNFQVPVHEISLQVRDAVDSGDPSYKSYPRMRLSGTSNPAMICWWVCLTSDNGGKEARQPGWHRFYLDLESPMAKTSANGPGNWFGSLQSPAWALDSTTKPVLITNALIFGTESNGPGHLYFNDFTVKAEGVRSKLLAN